MSRRVMPNSKHKVGSLKYHDDMGTKHARLASGHEQIADHKHSNAMDLASEGKSPAKHTKDYAFHVGEMAYHNKQVQMHESKHFDKSGPPPGHPGYAAHQEKLKKSGMD